MKFRCSMCNNHYTAGKDSAKFDGILNIPQPNDSVKIDGEAIQGPVILQVPSSICSFCQAKLAQGQRV